MNPNSYFSLRKTRPAREFYPSHFLLHPRLDSCLCGSPEVGCVSSLCFHRKSAPKKCSKAGLLTRDVLPNLTLLGQAISRTAQISQILTPTEASAWRLYKIGAMYTSIHSCVKVSLVFVPCSIHVPAD
ncbi:hypothetical protein CENSYa_0597 [Cenarchaeum symbiosum A]|uniref:Uncharacterized protein n=1 Tax=Cenarchaeum symbiosum (strain A) TaxID=414004 RepID=A0RV63_CENSY|nr:hypothetical protein CENSYa_0597 [Cenarchaeum symbiosum A]